MGKIIDRYQSVPFCNFATSFDVVTYQHRLQFDEASRYLPMFL